MNKSLSSILRKLITEFLGPEFLNDDDLSLKCLLLFSNVAFISQQSRTNTNPAAFFYVIESSIFQIQSMHNIKINTIVGGNESLTKPNCNTIFV